MKQVIICHALFLGKQKNYVSVSVTRLRPERPKREIPDYEYRYRDSYTRMSMGNGDAQLKAISKKMKLIGKGDYDYGDEDVFLGGKSGYGGSEVRSMWHPKMGIALPIYK